MKKFLENLIVTLYIIVAIFTTMCLLTFNKYRVSEFGDKTLVILDEEDSSLDYKKGDLIIVGKKGFEDAKEGDTLFFYESRGIKIAKIQKKNDFGEAGTTFTIDGNYQVVQEDVIGTSNNIKVISKAGTVLSLLESKWGFLFIIVFPSLLAFLYQIYALIKEISHKE